VHSTHTDCAFGKLTFMNADSGWHKHPGNPLIYSLCQPPAPEPTIEKLFRQPPTTQAPAGNPQIPQPGRPVSP
jgi:hypothetical protein